MLKNIAPLLMPDALYALATRGHGDDVAIIDANFPAVGLACKGGARLVQLAGANATQALRTVLQVLQLDDFVPQAAFLILRAGESRKYGNIVLRKGVIASDAP